MSIPLRLVPNQSAALAKLVPRAYFNNHEGHATFRYGSDRTAFTVALPQTRGRPSGVPSVTSQYVSDLSLSINREIHPKRCLLILTEPIPQAIGNRVTSALVVGELDTTRAHLHLL